MPRVQLAGDANRDRTVDSDDFNILATNFGVSIAPGPGIGVLGGTHGEALWPRRAIFSAALVKAIKPAPPLPGLA